MQRGNRGWCKGADRGWGKGHKRPWFYFLKFLFLKKENVNDGGGCIKTSTCYKICL